MLAVKNLAETVLDLAKGASFEATPREVGAHAEIWETAPQGARVYLTRLPKDTFASALNAARRLRQMGFVPVPHIAARMLEGAGQLADELARLTGEAGVDEVLLIAGSAGRPAGAFDNTMQALATGAFERAGVGKIGLAAHPEGHPQVDGAALQAAVDWKNGYARSTGTSLYFVTQFFFDARPVIAWERSIRARGNALPVRIGMHGVTGTARLLKHALHCGVGPSLKALTQKPASFFRLPAARTPGAMLVDLAKAMTEDPDSRFAGLHFFPLGGLAQTLSWVGALREGRFELFLDDVAMKALAVK